MGIFDFRDPNKRKKKIASIVFQCDYSEILINDTLVSFPTTYSILENILGEATRIEAIKQTNNKVYLWDNHGIYCSTNNPEKMLMLLLVEDNRYGLGHQPQKNFTGDILIDGEPIENTLKNVGTDRPYMIREIIKDNQRVAVAIGWNPSL